VFCHAISGFAIVPPDQNERVSFDEDFGLANEAIDGIISHQHRGRKPTIYILVHKSTLFSCNLSYLWHNGSTMALSLPGTIASHPFETPLRSNSEFVLKSSGGRKSTPPTFRRVQSSECLDPEYSQWGDFSFQG